MPTDDERPLVRVDRAALARVHDARERVIAALSDAFANDALDVEEFERRVTRAHTSESVEEIAALVTDLPAATTALAPATVALAPAAPGRRGRARDGVRDLRRRRSARDLDGATPLAGGRHVRRRPARSARGALPDRRHRSGGEGGLRRRPDHRPTGPGGRGAWHRDHGRLRRTSIARRRTPIRTRRCFASAASPSWGASTSRCGCPARASGRPTAATSGVAEGTARAARRTARNAAPPARARSLARRPVATVHVPALICTPPMPRTASFALVLCLLSLTSAACVIPPGPVTIPASGVSGQPRADMSAPRIKGANPFKDAYWVLDAESNARRTGRPVAQLAPRRRRRPGQDRRTAGGGLDGELVSRRSRWR